MFFSRYSFVLGLLFIVLHRFYTRLTIFSNTVLFVRLSDCDLVYWRTKQSQNLPMIWPQRRQSKLWKKHHYFSKLGPIWVYSYCGWILSFNKWTFSFAHLYYKATNHNVIAKAERPFLWIKIMIDNQTV